jgi:imidazolonepropionase-like amidohydrolase
MVASGLTPLQALRTATLNPAKFLRATDSLGSIAPGKVADLVLLDGNPLARIENTRRIRAVVANGRLYTRSMLDSLLRSVELGVKEPPK